MSKSVYSEYKDPSNYGVGGSSQDDELFRKLLGARGNRSHSSSDAFLSNAGAMEFTPEPKAKPIYLSALSQGIVKDYPLSQLHTEKILALEALYKTPNKRNYFNKEIPFIDNLPMINQRDKRPLARQVDDMKDALGDIQKVLDKNKASVRIVQEREPCSSDQFNCKNVFLPGFLPEEHELFHITTYGPWIQDEEERKRINAERSRNSYNNLWSKFGKQLNQSQSIQSAKNKFSSSVRKINQVIQESDTKSIIQEWQSIGSTFREHTTQSPVKSLTKSPVQKWLSPEKIIKNPFDSWDKISRDPKYRYDLADLERWDGRVSFTFEGDKSLRLVTSEEIMLEKRRRKVNEKLKTADHMGRIAWSDDSDGSDYDEKSYNFQNTPTFLKGTFDIDSYEENNQQEQQRQNRMRQQEEMTEEIEKVQELEDLLFV